MPELAYFPASMGTGLALQKACGLDEEGIKVAREVVSQYTTVLLNVRTLYRNYYSSHTAEERASISLRSGVEALNRDIRVAIEVVADHTDRRTGVALYSNSYAAMDTRYPYAKVKPPNTFLQRQYADFENQTVEALVEQSDDLGLHVYLGNLSLPTLAKTSVVLAMTHFPVDLLSSNKSYDRLDLLESHTGAIKDRLQWNTKLGISSDYQERIPFNAMTWQVFGDKGNMIAPQDIRLRKAVQELAKKYHWTPATTANRIKFSLKENGDPVLRSEVLRLL